MSGLMHRLSLIFALVIPMACGSTATAPDDGDKEGIEVDRKTEKHTEREVALPKPDEVKEFQRVWEFYKKDDPRWPRERNRFKARSAGAANILAAYFLKYYMEVNAQRDKRGKELVKVKNEVVEIGAPCAPFLVDLIVLDRIKRGDDQYFIIDDLTRHNNHETLDYNGTFDLHEGYR